MKGLVEAKQRFEDEIRRRVEKKTERLPSGCWEWQGKRHKFGYGMFHIFGKEYTVHRIVYELAKGPIPERLVVMHTCDNPPCINPDHLQTGTIAENMADMYSKGRNRQPRGERAPKAKLSIASVRDIRRRVAAGERQEAMAHEFGVARGSIEAIVRGYNWAWLDPDEPRETRRLGESNRGENHPRAKLTDAQAGEIRRCYETSEISQTALAEQYGVNQTTISIIVRGKRRVREP